jgi:hypothetical protein
MNNDCWRTDAEWVAKAILEPVDDRQLLRAFSGSGSPLSV